MVGQIEIEYGIENNFEIARAIFAEPKRIPDRTFPRRLTQTTQVTLFRYQGK
jgi:hypothetical protein